MAYIAQCLEISETTLALKKQAVSCQKGTLPRGEGRNMPFSSDTRGWKLWSPRLKHHVRIHTTYMLPQLLYTSSTAEIKPNLVLATITVQIAQWSHKLLDPLGFIRSLHHPRNVRLHEKRVLQQVIQVPQRCDALLCGLAHPTFWSFWRKKCLCFMGCNRSDANENITISTKSFQPFLTLNIHRKNQRGRQFLAAKQKHWALKSKQSCRNMSVSTRAPGTVAAQCVQMGLSHT